MNGLPCYVRSSKLIVILTVEHVIQGLYERLSLCFRNKHQKDSTENGETSKQDHRKPFSHGILKNSISELYNKRQQYLIHEIFKAVRAL